MDLGASYTTLTCSGCVPFSIRCSTLRCRSLAILLRDLVDYFLIEFLSDHRIHFGFDGIAKAFCGGCRDEYNRFHGVLGVDILVGGIVGPDQRGGEKARLKAKPSLHRTQCNEGARI